VGLSFFFFKTLCLYFIKDFISKFTLTENFFIDLILPVVVSNYKTNFKFFNSKFKQWYITLSFYFLSTLYGLGY
jgi:hypothetical protein